MWFNKSRPNGRNVARRPSFQPSLETLEARIVPAFGKGVAYSGPTPDLNYDAVNRTLRIYATSIDHYGSQVTVFTDAGTGQDKVRVAAPSRNVLWGSPV